MDFDVLIRGAEVFSGEGPGRRTDVGIVSGRIEAVGDDLPIEQAGEVVEAKDLMLCPGFIDMHAHSALQPFQRPELAPKIAQGFTTEVINPDGLAPAPVAPGCWRDRRAYLQALEGPGPEKWTWQSLAEYLSVLEKAGSATTLVPSIGHNAVRDRVMGGADRAPTPQEVAAMRAEVRDGLEAGARTLSFGLIYLPGAFAGTPELIELAKEAASFGAPLVPHVRNEASGVLEAVDEMIDVARRSDAPLHLSHLKVVGNEDLVEPLLERIDRAAEEIDLTFDQYPYGAGSTVLSALLPAWAQAGGPPGTLARLRDRDQRAAIVRDIQSGLSGWENIYGSVGPENVVIVQAAGDRSSDIGKTLAQIGQERKVDPLDAALDLLNETGLDAAMIDHYATEETVRTIFRHPRALVGSDGIFGPRPHPRLYGTAARVLGRYAIRERLIPVEDAIARLTSRAADRLRLSDRGRIKEGLRADLVLLDPTRYIDTATYAAPQQFPDGMVQVYVAGKAVWKNGAPTGALPGGVSRAPLTL